MRAAPLNDLMKSQCTKRVFTGERCDIGGHRCGRPAKKGSDLCVIHQPDREKAKQDRWERWYQATRKAETEIYAARDQIRRLVEKHPDFRKFVERRKGAEDALKEAEKIKKEPLK